MGAGGVGGPASGIGARPGMGAGGAGGPASGIGIRPGMGAGGAGGPASGIGVRPGMGAGGAGGPASGIGVRPGMGAGGLGGPASGIGVLPGLGAGGAGGPASGIGVRPGMGAGPIGTPDNYAARAAAGTYYSSAATRAAQSAAIVGAAAAYPAYGPGLYGGYPNAWPVTNLNNVSVYAHPPYGAMAATLGLAAAPVPYDYGSNVVAQSNAVYVNGDNAGTPQQYASQASQLAGSGQAQPDPNAQWQPLGVFAIAVGDQTSSDDTFQLAVNSQGMIRGNYHNVSSNPVEPLSGSIDKATQRAAWTIGSDQYPVYEAGIANLTQDTTTILVLTGEGQTNQLTLIRLPSPNQ